MAGGPYDRYCFGSAQREGDAPMQSLRDRAEGDAERELHAEAQREGDAPDLRFRQSAEGDAEHAMHVEAQREGDAPDAPLHTKAKDDGPPWVGYAIATAALTVMAFAAGNSMAPVATGAFVASGDRSSVNPVYPLEITCDRPGQSHCVVDGDHLAVVWNDHARPFVFSMLTPHRVLDVETRGVVSFGSAADFHNKVFAYVDGRTNASRPDGTTVHANHQ